MEGLKGWTMIANAGLNMRAVSGPAPCRRSTARWGAPGCRPLMRCFSVRVLALLAAGLLSFTCSSAFGDTVDPVEKALHLLSVGKPDSSAVKIRVWTNKEPGESFATGDRVILHFQADRDAYVAAISVSSKDGRVSIIFPNKDHPGTKIDKGKVYTLFGDDSGMRMKLVDTTEEGELVFYATTKQFSLDPLKPENQKTWISFPASDSDKVDLLRGKLKEIAGAEGFNRVALSPKDRKGGTLNIKLMGPAKGLRSVRPVRRQIPRDPKSERPDSVTGVQGEDAGVPLPNAR